MTGPSMNTKHPLWDWLKSSDLDRSGEIDTQSEVDRIFKQIENGEGKDEIGWGSAAEFARIAEWKGFDSPSRFLDKATLLKKFLKTADRNFSSIDEDSNGWLRDIEITKAVGNPTYKGEDALMLSALYAYREALSGSLDDELLRETGGVSRGDLQAFVHEALLNLNGPLTAEFVSDYTSNTITTNRLNGFSFMSDIVKGPRESVMDSKNIFEVNQGDVGDCVFLSCVMSLVQNHPEQIQKMIKDNLDGTYTVTFPGADKPVTIKRPTDAEVLVYSNSYGHGLWLSILEKAYVYYVNNQKFFPSENDYEAMKSADVYDGMTNILTGNIISSKSLETLSQYEIRVIVGQALQDKRTLMTGTGTTQRAKEGKMPNGLLEPHEYVIVDYDVATDTLLIHEPNDSVTYTNDEGVECPKGEIKISLAEYQKYFSTIDFEEKSGVNQT